MNPRDFGPNLKQPVSTDAKPGTWVALKRWVTGVMSHGPVGMLLLCGVGVGLVLAVATVLVIQPARAQMQQQPSGIGGPVLRNPYTIAPPRTASNTTPDNVMIILDASSSMEEKLPSGEVKMAAAKRAIVEVLGHIPDRVNVGLRIYGHSRNSFRACSATKTLVPLGVGNRQYIFRELNGVMPTGATPITHAINESITQDFMNAVGTKAVILVSDGEETCGGDPCGLAVSMMRRNVDVKVDVVGFGLVDYKDMTAIRQLRCVALSTYGKFYRADTAAELARSMDSSLNVKTEVQAEIVIPNTGGGSGQPSPTPRNSQPQPQQPVLEELKVPAPR